MNVVSKTHIGNVRASNQDALLLQDGKWGLYGVADGMGGHNGGDIASQMAVLMLGRLLEGQAPGEDALVKGFHEVNRLIYEEQEKDPTLSGMGTTLTVLWEDEKEILLGHIGDSRAYLLRSGQITQVSEDHSMVAQMVRDGAITEEQAMVHPYRNVITQAVGTATDGLDVYLKRLEKQRGDKYLVCSDGLYEYVNKEEMQKIMMHYSPEDAVELMIEKALEGGGKDNVTVLIAEVAL